MPQDVKKFIGVPFEELNCWDLFRAMYVELFGVFLPDFDGEYSCAVARKETSKIFERETEKWISIPAGEEKFGDAVVLYILGLPCHIGFVTENGFMIHSQEGTASSHESYRDSIGWKSRKKSFYRHAALA